MYDAVDLGCKKGKCLQAFKRRLKGLRRNAAPVHIRRSLSVDMNPAHLAVVAKTGGPTLQASIDRNWEFPAARFYLAGDFLEHLPTIEEAQAVLTRMIQAAQEGVWLRLPSFERDLQGEGQLHTYGLRFAWTTWSCHPAHVTVEHVLQVAKHFSLEVTSITKAKKIVTSGHESIVPLEADREARFYDTVQGPKPHVVFDPVIIGQWDVFLPARGR